MLEPDPVLSSCHLMKAAGWEGSSHDSKIFMHALRVPSLHFPHPPTDKYYLVDAGYSNFMGYLGPYKTTRYHLPHFRKGPRARGRNEVFNYLHSSLRSTIERSFGCCKAKWKILGNMPPFSLDTSTQIIVVCMALHNFIRRHDTGDEEFLLFDEGVELEDDDDVHDNVIWEEPNQASTRHMGWVRDIVRNQMPTTI
ncbi:hypothetical protein RIF29_25445 [Crotalaria pallida]|uniref:DDE Tnp4 domain-containing protein n=1 Tax=Crotalaria pallida TaxID=3830 RepID=A0AAN9ERK6_CROPI